MLTCLHRSLSIYVHSYLHVSCVEDNAYDDDDDDNDNDDEDNDDDDDDDDELLLQSYKAAGLRYMISRSTKTVINVSVASLVVAS